MDPIRAKNEHTADSPEITPPISIEQNLDYFEFGHDLSKTFESIRFLRGNYNKYKSVLFAFFENLLKSPEPNPKFANLRGKLKSIGFFGKINSPHLWGTLSVFKNSITNEVLDQVYLSTLDPSTKKALVSYFKEGYQS